MNYKAFHKLSYGLFIVASEFEGKKAGYIGNTVFQVTSEPPQIAISCHKKNESLEVIMKSGAFSVSVLKKEVSTSLIGEFGFMSGSDIDKFARVKIEKQVTGAPIVLDSAMAWFDCRVVNSVDVGSHILIIGEVLESRLISDDEPLTYAFYREKYKMFSPKNSPTYIEKSKLDSEPTPPKSQPEVATGTHTEDVSVDDETPYICTICGYVYRPEDGEISTGIPPGTPFSQLSDDYRCPICNAEKEYFKPLV